MPSSQACCRACRAKGTATANVWNYCAETGGCIYKLSDGRTVNMKAGQCELRYNLATNLAMGEPFTCGVCQSCSRTAARRLCSIAPVRPARKPFCTP